jgi:peptidoglycan/LPS O-acetylase OafA/YrhL
MRADHVLGGELNAPRVDSETVQSTARRLDVQGLRAVAVFVVVAFHAGLNVPGGFTGVDIFFVISGFVITAMLAREWQSTGTLRFRTFYARRFRRLTPALAVLVLVVVVISALIQSPLGAQQITAETGIGALFLAANIVIANNTGGYFDATAAANPLLNTWSLSVEEQFYLIWPVLAGLCLRWKVSIIKIAIAIAAIRFKLVLGTGKGRLLSFI